MTLKTDTEIVNEAPDQAVTYCMYDYGDAMEGNYLNCENQFFDPEENSWVDMDLVENYFHSPRRISDIKNIDYLFDRTQKLEGSLKRISTYSKNCEENITISDIIHEETYKYT